MIDGGYDRSNVQRFPNGLLTRTLEFTCGRLPVFGPIRSLRFLPATLVVWSRGEVRVDIL